MQVLSAESFVQKCKELRKEALFVDTNIIIQWKDPLGTASSQNTIATNLNVELTKSVTDLKDKQLKIYSTLSTAIEYFWFVRYHYFMRELKGKLKFDTREFKRLKKDDSSFALGWQQQMKNLKKVFITNFPIYTQTLDKTFLFGFTEISLDIDFGDYTIFQTVLQAPPEHRVLFSNDSDYLACHDKDFLLITTSAFILKESESRGLLYTTS
ncbi:MAG: hypothetical protein JNJ85_09810 [Candidatus Kapabacteria bacterium]|nr:hypothetical protein [Candidatus Kapabacteria bacterium]MBX7155891.1 hypothetical protein [Bacteroidota bacterium]